MTPREKFHAALNREKIVGHVPHFELVMFLTMEMIGRIHPAHRHYYQWNQMSATEKKLHIDDMAHCYVDVAKMYDHSAILVHIVSPPEDFEPTRQVLERIREMTGDTYSLMTSHDPTLPMPDGESMIEFTTDMYENPDKLHEKSKTNLAKAMDLVAYLDNHKGLVDGFALCSDYCFNQNPFFTADQFDEFIVPYLKEIIACHKQHGFYSIKHTDGNIMPIVDKIIQCGPEALHSLDPQGGVDLKEMKTLYGDTVCLVGNVNCGLLQTGTDQQVQEDVRRALRDGMEGGYGYIFSTSNCVYTGLSRSRYELMHSIWKNEGVYKE